MYPKRSTQHIADTKARGLFLNAVPNEWICREMLERDYGIDYYLELVGNRGDLTGHLVAVQLKGTQDMQWKGKGITQHTLYSGIKTKTISYWMSLQIPVFLCVVEFSSSRVFFAPIKRQVRARYNRYLKYNTFGFRLIRMLELSHALGHNILAQEYYRERSRERFTAGATDLVIHSDYYRDYFKKFKSMGDKRPVSISDQITLGSLYSNFQMIKKYTGCPLKINSLEKYYELNKKTYPSSKEVLHVFTIKQFIGFLESDYNKVLATAKTMITKSESSYWSNVDPVLYKLFKRVIIT